VAAVALLGGCRNPAEGKPEAEVAEPVETHSAPAAGQSYSFSEESTIDFVGSKVTGSHDGGFKAFGGGVELVNNDPTASSVRVEIDTTSLWADDERLQGHLMSADFFDVEKHPTATFESTSIAAGEQGYDVTGNLTLHGVTRSITFPATIEVADGRVTADAEFFVMRFDFDMVYPGKADDLIRDEVVIKLHLVAVSNSGA
jgi:polyisoprenoid-binding protein YceI